MTDRYLARSKTPRSRILYLDRDPPARDNVSIRGWNFIVEDVDGSGNSTPLYDSWEENFYEIVRYPPEYSDEELIWIDLDTGDKFSIQELELKYKSG